MVRTISLLIGDSGSLFFIILKGQVEVMKPTFHIHKFTRWDLFYFMSSNWKLFIRKLKWKNMPEDYWDFIDYIDSPNYDMLKAESVFHFGWSSEVQTYEL